MCSARSGADAAPEAAARERILRVAIDLVGREGAPATTVRRVAAAAEVSPALVMHHFGSKAGLLAACDDEVMATIRRAIEGLGSDDLEVSFAELLAAESASPAVGYVGRAMHEGGEAGRRWFDWMIELTRQGMADLADAGLARPADDPEMQAVLLLAMDIGVVLMRHHVERYLGAAITDDHITARWATAELDLLTHGVLLAHAEHDPGTPPERSSS